MTECWRQVGKKIPVQFQIIRSGDSGEFEIDGARQAKVIQLKYSVSGLNAPLRNISAVALFPRLTAKLQKKLKNAVFVWQQKVNQFNFPPQVQVYPTPNDPGMGSVANLIAEWIQIWFNKWGVRGVQIKQLKLKDVENVIGQAQCDDKNVSDYNSM